MGSVELLEDADEAYYCTGDHWEAEDDESS